MPNSTHRTTRPYRVLVYAFALGLAAAGAVSACASHGAKDGAPQAAAADNAQPNQTQIYAARRAQAVHEPTYKIRLELDANRDTFRGEDEIKFGLTQVLPDLALDFRGGRVTELKINGQTVAGAEQKNGLVTLPADRLKVGANVVTVRFEQTYSKDGRGLYRFKDPEDGRVYLYTQFETVDANHMFPCFDQPDLKATYELTTLAPKEWEVVSTMRESASPKAKGADREWTFPATPKLSPYVFSMHAGPYKVWTSTAGKGSAAIPLRLFARQSLAKYVKPEEWFRPTREGLGFYGGYFAYPYPFKKYDQLIVPDFNAGAMENVAAVTFSERFVHRGPATREDRERMASVILHEMAHMWFGDLVTMRWWNGLWLNESFATYMSALAMANATEFKESWMSFYASEKRWAYWEDQLVTTHPINGAVPDTDSAFENFDGITYGKGASVLKQLAFYLGEDKFRDGVRAYFKSHQYGNTELADFLGALGKSAGRDLKDWSRLWLESQGLDSVAAQFACAGGKIASFDLALSAPEGESVTRPHRTKIGLYELSGKRLRLRKSLAVSYEGAKTSVTDLKGEKCPDFVYPNEGDQDYVKVRLDAESLKVAQASLSSFSDEFARAMIWPNLYEMVRDGEMPVQRYVELALTHAPKETDIKVTEAILRTLQARGALYYFPQTTTDEKAARTKVVGDVENMVWRGLSAAKAGTDWQKTYYDSFADIAETPAALGKLADLLSGKTKLKGLVLDQDRRWAAVARLNGFNFAGSDALLASEKEKDKSDVGIRWSLASEAIRPEAASKQKLLAVATSEQKDLTLARRRAVLNNVFPAWQDQFRSELGRGFYGEILKRAPKGDPEFLRVYARTVPTVCTIDSQEEIDKFLRANGETLPPVVRKPLMVSRQENGRCLRVRAKAQQASAAPVPEAGATPQ